MFNPMDFDVNECVPFKEKIILFFSLPICFILLLNFSISFWMWALVQFVDCSNVLARSREVIFNCWLRRFLFFLVIFVYFPVAVIECKQGELSRRLLVNVKQREKRQFSNGTKWRNRKNKIQCTLGSIETEVCSSVARLWSQQHQKKSKHQWQRHEMRCRVKI